MLLLLLLCHLTAASALPRSLSSARISRILSARNGAEAGLDTDYQLNREQRICETTYCNEIAQKLLRSMDTSVDPCQDFYRYACGSWKEHNPIPDTEVEWSEDLAVMQKTHERIRDVLEEPDKPDDILPVKLARKLYRSCMNVDAIEERGIKPILEILEKAGGWPIATYNPRKRWRAGGKSWQEVDKQYIRLIGNSAFFNLNFELDQNNTKQYLLVLDQDTDYSLESLTEETQASDDIDAYIEGLIRIIVAFAKAKGHVLNEATLLDDMTKMVLFEVELREILHRTEKEKRDLNTNYERMTIEKLQQWYNSAGVTSGTAKINFLEVIQYAFMLGNVSINASEPIVVYNRVFLHKLARLLGRTSRRTLVNYVQWNFVNKVLTYTTQEMRDIMFSMSYSSYNISKDIPRWKVCVLNMEMKDAVSYMFIKKYMSDDVIDKAKEMLEKLREQMRLRIAEARWLTESGKKSLTKKLDTVVPQIGYPEWYKDDQAVIKHYDGLQIGSDYFQNVMSCARNELIRNIKMYREPTTRSLWMEYPTTVNAFYAQTINAILIPAAELQDPYFTPLLPDAVNYGTTGFVIGHELSHSFDDEGIKFDSEGVRTDWVSQEVFDGFEDRAMCFVNQYGNYTLDVQDEDGQNIQVDGNLTVSENIADSIGIQVAFSAYKKVAKQENQSRLPGLENISNDKLFFLTFANSWCSSTRSEYTVNVINNDEHSPAKYRIIGSLSNLPEFSQTFGCSRRSPMNPPNKCNLWS